jgi:glycosyltransferase involved in cell wall biosynthesis
MKISVVTAAFNAAGTIADCLASVASQTIPVEHIIIDGASSDDTVRIVREMNPRARVLSEPDKGIYDAMNKGIRLATGDVVGILNADDFYENDRVIEKIIGAFAEHQVDSVFADLVYVNPKNLDRIIRHYRAARFTPDKLSFGIVPPHPTFFVRKRIYEQYGCYKTDYMISSDYEMFVRLLSLHKISYFYLPESIVRMRTGGVSTKNLRHQWIGNKEIVRACRENGLRTNMLLILSKYFTKIFQLAGRYP